MGIGFIAFGTCFHPGVYIRFLRWHFALKRRRDELFSERYGHTPTYRLAGLSLSVRRVRDPA